VAALAGPDRTLEPDDLEVAVLSRANGRRAFRRLAHDELAERMTPGRRTTSRASKAAGSGSEPPASGDGGPLRSE
jgi:hypothetical protein